jgi:uncharacterized membrane protein YgaE (UPF0421/DUF939 family)
MKTAPLWLRVAAALTFGERFALFAFQSATVFGATAVIAVVLVVLFLLQGSRVAWVVVVAWAVTQLSAPFAYGAPDWVIGSAVAILVCLLTPESWAFVWTKRAPRLG